MCDLNLQTLVNSFPFHFVLKTDEDKVLSFLERLDLHDQIARVAEDEYVVFFADDQKMNHCFTRVQRLINGDVGGFQTY